MTAYHLRLLCENPWNGGAGYTPEQVSQMTLDQIWFRLCDPNVLKRDVGGRTENVSALTAVGTVKQDAQGRVIGRARDGTPIIGSIRGKSKARELMELERQKRKPQGRRR